MINDWVRNHRPRHSHCGMSVEALLDRFSGSARLASATGADA
jgi:hypothetical protein